MPKIRSTRAEASTQTKMRKRRRSKKTGSFGTVRASPATGGARQRRVQDRERGREKEESASGGRGGDVDVRCPYMLVGVDEGEEEMGRW